VAVAAQLANLGTLGGEYVAFFDRALIPKTEIEVTPGRIAFMGDLLVDLKTRIGEDEMHYLRLVEPGAARKGFLGRTLSHEYMYRGELIDLDRTAAAETAFWKLALGKIFDRAPDWRARVEQQVAAGNDR
jgi:hypothetical protein